MFKIKSFVFWHIVADEIKVLLDILDFLFYLLQEWRSFQMLFVILCKENWEVLKSLWENVNEWEEERLVALFKLLKNIGGQERVLWTEQPHLQVVAHHLLSQRRFFCHLQGDNLLFRDKQDLFLRLYMP